MSDAVVVVADSGPLIALANIEKLDLLPSLYRRVKLPRAVWREVTQGVAERKPGAEAIQKAEWIDVEDVDPITTEGFKLIVDAGEAEAVALARRHADALLLMDDDKGRRLALRLGLRIKGTLGVLIAAKRAGLLATIRAELEALVAKRVFISEALIVATLKEAGE